MSLGENSLVAAYQGKGKRTVDHQRTTVVTYSLNKLESYTCSRISSLGPVGHCTSHFKRAVFIFCRRGVEVQKGGRADVDACGQGEGVKNVIFVDVINGWPLTLLS